MYKDAKKAEVVGEDQKAKGKEEKKESPFDDPTWENLNNVPFNKRKHQETFDKEVNNLIEWCDSLDYEKYIDNWQTLATSALSALPTQP